MVNFHKRILFSDEAYFWLNDYVNKQNCRIWSEANPQVYVETPLHPEKMTVLELWFQQDGATCHTARATINLLKDTFGDRLISRFGPVNWPPRFCDLAPRDYFLWGYVKSLVYADKPQTHVHLEDNIRRVIAEIRPQILEKVIENWTSILDYIRASRGSSMPEIIFKIAKKKLRIEEREEKLRFEQLRLDEQKRKNEFELEKLRIRTQSKLGADTSKKSYIKFLVKLVSKFIHRFDLKEDISLYLKSFERQAQRLNIDQENWVSHLLGLLPTEVSHIIAREPDDKANSYEHVKDLLLKRFKLTPEKFRQLFVTHQTAPERTWIDFYHELHTYFNGWIDGLKIDTFKKVIRSNHNRSTQTKNSF
ncbi:transposable element Tc3 transposase [Trichonephila clavipes]|nr:transposable element Tc3 transposase [Trichonephila clavipes]